jgi:hypothetical protein
MARNETEKEMLSMTPYKKWILTIIHVFQREDEFVRGVVKMEKDARIVCRTFGTIKIHHYLLPLSTLLE